MKGYLFVWIYLFMAITSGIAQTVDIVGSVVSEENGEPLVGATVLVKGVADLGAVTDLQGKFLIKKVPGAAKSLQISYVGMRTVEVAIAPSLKIILKPAISNLDEVVVIGYGNGKNVSRVVGAVNTVGSEQLSARPISNVMDAMQGQVPGLQIYTSSGEPGESSTSYLRGVSSLTTSSEPLYVMDGVPVSPGVMVVINPEDIENIVVLKDAAATSIYGVRASNGVIYITTKKGQSGDKAIVTIYGSYGISSLARRIGNPMSSSELLNWQLGNKMISQQFYDDRIHNGVDTNWEKYFFKSNTPTFQANLSIQGGNSRTNYYVSGSYYNQEGIVPYSSYERYTFRSNIGSQATDWLKMGANVSVVYDEVKTALFTRNGKNHFQNGTLGAVQNPPYYNPYDKDGNKLDLIEELGDYSPDYLSSKQPNYINEVVLQGQAFLELTPFKGFTFRSRLGIEACDDRVTLKRLPSDPGAKVGFTKETSIRTLSMITSNTVEYEFNITHDHDFTVLLGQEGIKTKLNGFAAKTSGQSDDRLTLLSSGTTAELLGNDEINRYVSEFLSFFGRLDYVWKGKYLASFTVRSDASSRFTSDNRTAVFVSGGLMWNMKKEKFMENLHFLSAVTFRTSIGTTGNASIGDYHYLALAGTNMYDAKKGWVIQTPGTPDLTWEDQLHSNIGLEVEILNKYKVGLSYYNRNIKHMLLYVPLPHTTGFESKAMNTGGMINSGWEVSVGLEVFKNKDWFVGFNMNYSYNQNKITELFDDHDQWALPEASISYKVGDPIQFYLPLYAGVDPQDGAPMWYVPGTDGEKTKKYGDYLLQPTGKKRFAPHSGGLGLNVSWKNLSLSTDFAWVLGRSILNNDRYYSENPTLFGPSDFNQNKDVLQMWQKPGDISEIPAYGYVMQFDTHLLENASFLRMKNIHISYRMPKTLLKSTRIIQDFTLTVGARNLFTITKYKGADPEVDSGIVLGAYPNTRQFTLGAEVKF